MKRKRDERAKRRESDLSDQRLISPDLLRSNNQSELRKMRATRNCRRKERSIEEAIEEATRVTRQRDR